MNWQLSARWCVTIRYVEERYAWANTERERGR
jgi:hypothetical protein